MPLTIYLVKNVSGNVSGLTDAKDSSNIKIMIEPALLFENTLHHEIMYYIDIYLFCQSNFFTKKVNIYYSLFIY